MSQNRKVLVEEITMAVDAFKYEMVELKVKTELSIPEDAHKLHRDVLVEAHTWIMAIYNKEFAAVKKVRKLLTPEQWERYKLWASFSRTQEMKLLRKAQVEFRKVVTTKDRPSLFRKGASNGTKEESESGDHGSTDQEQGQRTD